MHDIDRTQMETWEAEPGEFEYETYQEFEGPFNEVEEMELASQLLEVTDEAELDQFLGSLFKKASRAVGSFMKGPIGKQLGGMLKGIAKKALPLAGGALGSIVPGAGTMLGGALGSAASNLFELELEGLSAEDQEFEVARQFVKLAGEAAKQAAQIPPNVPPTDAAKQAIVTAAQQYAPGLLKQTPTPAMSGGGRGRSGRWIRRGNKIVLYGA
ncbi:hypothetical protein TFLX_06486 [Thermoflexales bacterium]|nr:hypothetical protein TFLX_06486 [Thermoflexales bacterium]